MRIKNLKFLIGKKLGRFYITKQKFITKYRKPNQNPNDQNPNLEHFFKFPLLSILITGDSFWKIEF